MYDNYVAIIIGIVEGLTEFLPVSSTGHMILTQELLNITHDDSLLNTFDIVIQLGAILAVVLVYWNRILSLFGIRVGVQQAKPNQMDLIHILIGIIPAMALAFFFEEKIDTYLFSPYTVLVGLVLGGILLIAAEKIEHSKPLTDDLDNLSYRQALSIGLWQIVSLWPGFSRSGSTIAAGMLVGTNRKVAADFTFIMAIPIMFAASGYKLLTTWDQFTPDSASFFAIGFLVSFMVALLAVVTFIKLVSKLKLTYFAYYRFALAAVFLVYLLVKR
ncbi:undecaprenyl-diphosphate phosphatase [Paenibacillus albiflavus]|uniref:Undecaprenyl-diphosphatase n=1 Tax=Paenibacillus albiflavus TaxID=2545760 RepID=A0A4R4EDQ2_9BACL|nr:undecaprenyl-diphosphate phosphatase [Paenibacillus albiflavus]TCZ76138.1 undecaprenyl-diphosphate phosphatase [Paenibacillus albiflavus]